MGHIRGLCLHTQAKGYLNVCDVIAMYTLRVMCLYLTCGQLMAHAQALLNRVAKGYLAWAMLYTALQALVHKPRKIFDNIWIYY